MGHFSGARSFPMQPELFFPGNKNAVAGYDEDQGQNIIILIVLAVSIVVFWCQRPVAVLFLVINHITSKVFENKAVFYISAFKPYTDAFTFSLRFYTDAFIFFGKLLVKAQRTNCSNPCFT